MSCELPMSVAPGPLTAADSTATGKDVEYATEAFSIEIHSDVQSVADDAVIRRRRILSSTMGTGTLLLADAVLERQADDLRCISFHDLCYEVSQRKACIIKQPNKKILKSLNGVMLPGLNAIMGTSGSGKSTLLDILADRKNKADVSGTVLVNGKRKPSNYKSLVGYVVQDDIVMGSLTVRENLWFSAALRLPSSMTKKEKKARVESVITELGIQHCAKSTVGTEFIRGISGGERRRTNIGMELIIEPQILFLDEPTTGLDSHTAASVIELVKQLSKVNNRIIIMSIHQPRYSIFKLFDTLTLLAHGELVFQGHPRRAMEFLEDVGCSECEEHENPADFLLDSIYECESGHAVEDGGEDPKRGHLALHEEYKRSTDFQQLKPVLDSIAKAANPEDNVRCRSVKSKFISSTNYATSFFFQLLLVSLRSAVNLVRSPTATILQLVTQILVGLLIGAIYFQLSDDRLGFQDRLGVLFFVTIQIMFSNIASIDLFLQQKALFLHEHASSYYRVSAYFLSKVTTDVIPVRLLPNLVFALITYFLIGLQLDAGKFFIYYMFINLTSFAGASVVFFVSAAVSTSAVANIITTLIFIVSVQFGGVLISLDSLPVWIGWLKYISFIRYAVEGVSINEMDGLTFCDGKNSSCETFDGLDELGVRGYETDWLWYDALALVIHIMTFLLLAYIMLRLTIRKK